MHSPQRMLQTERFHGIGIAGRKYGFVVRIRMVILEQEEGNTIKLCLLIHYDDANLYFMMTHYLCRLLNS